MDIDTEMDLEDYYSNLSNIQRFFYGQSVFITGVTGLVGKVVLEKLLRSCPGIGMIYIHMRKKRGLTPEQRLEKLLKVELFREIRKEFPLFHKKIQVVSGDITEQRLGMSLEDYEKVQQNVSIVIHSAASVNFKDTLKSAINHNLIATKRILELCRNLRSFKAAVHVSTAFVERQPDGTIIEKTPKYKVAPEKIIETLEWADEKTEKAITDYLTDNILTTYLVTKAMAENIIEDTRGDLPIGVVRPAYIAPTYKEPFPGWIDQLQGMSGLMLAGAKGVLRALESVKSLKINVVPVDVVSNTIITTAWHVGVNRPVPLFIVNCVLNYEKLPNANQDILDFVLKKRTEYPLVNMFRYPHFTVYYNKYAYNLHALIDQWIPALFVDLFLYIFTGRTILIKVYAKINFLYGIFYRLGKDPWIGRMDNYYALMNTLSEEDAKIFSMDTDTFDWPNYIDNCMIGGRKFLAREDPSNIPYAKKKAAIWWAVTTALKWCIILFFVYYLLTRSSYLNPIYKSITGNFRTSYS